MFSTTYTSFHGQQRIASGSLQDNALAVKTALESKTNLPILTFDDATGKIIDIDTRGSDEEISARFAQAGANEKLSTEVIAPKSSGRPKLGVVAKEITLLPRHWEWLSTQPGGASATLRKLVETAQRNGSEKDRRRRAQDRAYQFMFAIAGDLPGFEEISRALFADDLPKVKTLLAAWPVDIRQHALHLLEADH